MAEIEKSTARTGWVRVAREDILRLRSAAGGWSRAQLALLGVPWPPPAGWLDQLEGSLVSRDVLRRCGEMRKQRPARDRATTMDLFA